MKERPILFSAPMVRALLDGRKTQTRRIVELNSAGRVTEPGGCRNWHLDDPDAVKACPYGQPDDQLWVRETWNTSNQWKERKPSEIPEGVMVYYAADYSAGTVEVCKPWRPSIHMCYWMSRIQLEITGVRVERLNEISEADAIAEGIIPVPKTVPHGQQFWRDYRLIGDGTFCVPSPIESYRSLWESLGRAGNWARNPWVWVVEFRRVTP